MGYKKDIEIDINNLDTELLRQASLFQYWGRQEANVLYEKDQVEEALSKCKARVELDIRKDPEKYGYTNKLTEGAVTCLLVQQQEVVEAVATSLKCRYKARILGIAVKSFEHKKKALEKLVELYISGYWATPKVDSEAQRAFDDRAQKIIHKSMKGDEQRMVQAKKNESKRLADVAKDKEGLESETKAKPKATDPKPKTTGVKVEGKEKGKKKGKSSPKPTGKTKAELSKRGRSAHKNKK